MARQSVVSLVLICFFALLGGVCSPLVLRLVAPSSFAAIGGDPISRFVDDGGRVRMEIGVVNGQPMENLWGEDGKLRAQLGTYDGGVSPAEKGLPVLTLSDNQGRLKMLLRIAPGVNQSPVLVMKDNADHDRIIMGLSLNGSGEEPFLVYYDKDGTKHTVFGAF